MEMENIDRRFRMPTPRELLMETDTWPTDAELRYQDSQLALGGWGPEAGGHREPMVAFHQLSVPMDWQQPISVPATVGLNAPTTGGPCMAAEPQYAVPPPTDWFQPTSYQGPNIGTGNFEAQLSPSSSVPWNLAANPPASYPITPLESEATSPILTTNWQQDGPARLPEHQPLLTNEYSLGHDRRGPLQLPTGAEEGVLTRPRGPPSMQTPGLDAESPCYWPPPSLRRDSTSDTSYPASPRSSLAAYTFDPNDAYRLGSTNVATPMMLGADDATIRADQPKPASRTHARGRRTSARTSISSTASQPANKPSVQARNRAAASRYRAKTQADSQRLQAAEREISMRHDTLLACAGELREEVYQLKNELLRHGDCDDPLIRGYLSRLAKQAAVVLRADGGGNGRHPSI